VRRAALMGACCVWLCGCEERVVRVSGGLTGVAGAQGGPSVQRAAVSDTEKERAFERMNNPMGYPPPEERAGTAEIRDLRWVEPDGTVRVVSRNPRELLYQLQRALREEDGRLIERELLAARTKEAYRHAGKDTAEAAAFLLKYREDLLVLFQQFPMGELTPGVFAQPSGVNQFYVEAEKGMRDGMGRLLRFRGIEWEYESDACRLVKVW